MGDNIDEDEIKYLSSSSVVNRYGGEDLCERANICRRNGYHEISVPLNDYNEGYIERMSEKEQKQQMLSDYEVETMVMSVFERDNASDYSNHSSEHKLDEEDIEELFAQTDIPTDWTPNVLSKPKEEFVTYSSILDSFEESMFSYITFEQIKVNAYDSVQKAFPFKQSFLNRLKTLECKDVKLELYLWSAILKQISITCISGPKTGKTTSYLIPLIYWFDCIKDPEEEISIGAIIICSSVQQSYTIAQMAKQWRDPKVKSMEQTIKIISMNSTNEKRQMTSLLNGCDILVTTPKPLLRAIESSLIDCSKTKTLIIDDADINLELNKEVIYDIYLNYAKMKKNNKRFIQKNGKVSNPMAFQTMIFAQKWTKEVRHFCQEVQHNPTIVFGSFYETSIAFKVEPNVRVIDDEEKRDPIIESLIRDNIKQKRIAMVFRNENEIIFIEQQLKRMFESIDKSKHFKVYSVTHKTPHYDLDQIREKWNHSGGLLLINDEAIKIVGNFQKCYSLLHYKLPNYFSITFGDRFRLMTKQFKKSKSPLDIGKMPKLFNYMVISPSDNHITDQLIAYLTRLEVSIPKKLLEFSNYYNRSLCNNFCSFGYCPFAPLYCSDRHEFNKLDVPNPELPFNGEIKITLTYVMGANQFYFRLQEFRNEDNTSGQWRKMNIIYEDIKSELNALKDMPFNTVKEICDQQIYGISIRGEVLRVRVTRCLAIEELKFYEEYDPNDKTLKIELFCIDFGHKLRSRLRQLFELPQKLQDFPPFAFKGYLFGIKPIDNEIEWDFRSTQKFYELVDNFRVTQITAWILKQIDGTFWLNKMNVENKLKNAKLKVSLNPIKFMIEKKIVEQNTKKVPEFNTDYNRIVNIWHNYRLNTTVYNSYLIDFSTYVVVTDFVSLNEFYIMHESRVKRLQELENKWLSLLPNLETLKEISENQICFYKGTDITTKEVYLNRAKVVSNDGDNYKLFLVDHGETVLTAKTNLFKISSPHLNELPFQAIKVSLFGVKEVEPITYNLICDLTRNEKNDYLIAIAQKLNYENGIYSIRLYVAEDPYETHFVSLANTLVDMEFAEYVDGEENEEFVINVEKTIDNINDEIESEYMLQLEEEMKNNLVIDFLKTTLNVSDEDFYPKSVTNGEHKKPVNESLASKTRRRLKAISAKNNNIVNDEESDEEEDNPFVKRVVPNSGDFDYDFDASNVLSYDPSDHIDDECDFSDEDGILLEEEFS